MLLLQGGMSELWNVALAAGFQRRAAPLCVISAVSCALGDAAG